MNPERLALHWGSKYSALHGGARITRRPLRFWVNEIAPALLAGIVGSGALVGLLAWAKWAAAGGLFQ